MILKKSLFSAKNNKMQKNWCERHKNEAIRRVHNASSGKWLLPCGENQSAQLERAPIQLQLERCVRYGVEQLFNSEYAVTHTHIKLSTYWLARSNMKCTYLILTEDGDVGDVERLSLADGVLENARVSALIVSGGVLDEQGRLQGGATLVVLPAVEHHRRSVSQPATHTNFTLRWVICLAMHTLIQGTRANIILLCIMQCWYSLFFSMKLHWTVLIFKEWHRTCRNCDFEGK